LVVEELMPASQERFYVIHHENLDPMQLGPGEAPAPLKTIVAVVQNNTGTIMVKRYRVVMPGAE
jgi:hypothetical protein